MVQAKIKLARDEGKWPGWNKKKDENGELVEDENASAKKLFSQTGSCINWTAHDKAETALGLHLLDNCTWFLPLFDCYQQVCISITPMFQKVAKCFTMIVQYL